MHTLRDIPLEREKTKTGTHTSLEQDRLTLRVTHTLRETHTWRETYILRVTNTEKHTHRHTTERYTLRDIPLQREKNKKEDTHTH